MKKYIGAIFWLIAAVIWAVIAWTYYTQGNDKFAILQVIVSIICAANGILSIKRKIRKK